MSDAALSLRPLDNGVAAELADARHGDPFSVLGPHGRGADRVIRAFLPGARQVEVLSRDGRKLGTLDPGAPTGLFVGKIDGDDRYVLRVAWPGGVQETEDPYSFGPLLGDLDLHLFNEGRHFDLSAALGAQAMTIDGVRGVRFAVWAPNARRVAVVGDFNGWDGRRHAMRLRFPPASGSCSCRASPRARITNTRSAAPMGRCCRSRPIPSASRRRCRRPPRPSSPSRWSSAGAMRSGCARARSAMRRMRRSASTKSTWRRGCTATKADR